MYVKIGVKKMKVIRTENWRLQALKNIKIEVIYELKKEVIRTEKSRLYALKNVGYAHEKKMTGLDLKGRVPTQNTEVILLLITLKQNINASTFKYFRITNLFKEFVYIPHPNR